jgi:uncharacterized protein (TIGR00725 family)
MEEKTKLGDVYDYLKICISGAADTGHCGLDAYEKAKTLGREIVHNKGVIVTGATTGFPLWAAMAAKEVGGFSIGFSPAGSEKEHTEVYNLPTDYMDIIIYTGFGYPGRDLILTRSADAVIFGCGRIGTIHEFTIAFEDNKPIGILEADWDTDDVVKMIIEKGNRPNPKVIFDTDPKALVERVMEMVRADREHHSTFRFEKTTQREKNVQ